MSEYKEVVCPECKNGDYQDHEPGDTLRCPWCEKRVTLEWLHRIDDDDDGLTNLSALHEVPYSNVEGAYVKVKQEQQPDDLLELGNPQARETEIREGTIVGRAEGTGLYYDSQRRENVVDTIGPCIYIETPEDTVLEVSTEKTQNELLEFEHNE